MDQMLFISRAGADRDIAKRIDAILREAGYRTFLQDFDFGHKAFPEQMEQAFRSVEAGARTVALLSQAYQSSAFCRFEAQYPLTDDPHNTRERLIVLRIEECNPIGLLKPIPYTDLVPYLNDTPRFNAAVLSAVQPPGGQRRQVIEQGSQLPKSVLWSTRKSIENQVPSATGIIETILAVISYWLVAIYFATYALLVAGAVVAPLVLLRSDESVSLGTRWFRRWEQRARASNISARSMSFFLRFLSPSLRVLIGFVIGYFLGHYFLLNLTDQQAFFGSLASVWIASGAAKVMTVALFTAAAKQIVLGGADVRAIPLSSTVQTAAGAAVGTIVATAPETALRLVAGTLHDPEVEATVLAGAMLGAVASPLFGYASRRASGAGAVVLAAVAAFTVAGAAINVSPVLATGGIAVFGSAVLGSSLAVFLVSVAIRVAATLRYLPQGVATLPSNFRKLVLCTSPLQAPELVPGLDEEAGTIFTFRNRWRESLKQNDLLGWSITLFLVTVWFMPAWFYRLSLKSTAWFWWPIAFLIEVPRRATGPGWFLARMTETPGARAIAWIAFIMAGVFGLANAYQQPWFEVLPDGLPASIFRLMFIMDRTRHPWQSLLPILILLTWAIFVYSDYAKRKRRLAIEENDPALYSTAQRDVRTIEFLGRMRIVFFGVYAALIGGYLILYENSQSCSFRIPTEIQDWAGGLYGEHSLNDCGFSR